MDNKVIYLVIGVFLLFGAGFLGARGIISDLHVGALSLAGGMAFIASALSPRRDDK